MYFAADGGFCTEKYRDVRHTYAWKRPFVDVWALCPFTQELRPDRRPCREEDRNVEGRDERFEKPVRFAYDDHSIAVLMVNGLLFERWSHDVQSWVCSCVSLFVCVKVGARKKIVPEKILPLPGFLFSLGGHFEVRVRVQCVLKRTHLPRLSWSEDPYLGVL